MRTILDMNCKAAKRFFFRPRSYFSLALPSYYQFDRLLTHARELLMGHNLQNYYLPDLHPQHFDDVNYTIIYNKDGKYAWRKYQIIHPFFYTEMVHLLTTQTNWDFVKAKTKEFRNPLITCASMIPAPTSKLNRNEQDIFNWAGNFTNETVRRALKYKYMLATDMTNCYDTLPFYLLQRALYGKTNLIDYNLPLIGHQLCTLLQDISYGQGCGIPQGSILMDFLAEIILSYLDSLIYTRLPENLDAKILRYRDDYRIFANEATIAKHIMKVIVETLAEFNLKINLSKTFLTTDVIKHAFKPDRLAWRTIGPTIFGDNKLSVLKSLLLIQNFGRNYPNCGSLKAALSTLYAREIYDSGCHDDIWQAVSVVSDIMYTNPGVWPHGIAILSKYIDAHESADASRIIEAIRAKFIDVPNTEYLEIWLQRLSVKENPYYKYDNRLSKTLFEPNTHVWNSQWLGMQTNLCDADMISYDEILTMPNAIPAEEVALFVTSHSSGG